MSRLSELEQFLLEQVEEGTHDSAGQFTLSRDKALEKLAAFQLPRATAWVLKVVQAAVVAASDALFVRQTGTDTEFLFTPPSHWTLDMVEAAFYDPEIASERALDHFKRALWSVSLNDMRPFRLVLPGSTGALVWTGHEFRRLAAAPQNRLLLLTVSHRSVYAGKGIVGLRTLQAARTNADILAELVNFAFVCPIQLQVDSRRLDALQGCPHHGCNPKSYPIRLGFAKSEGPPFRIPPLTLGRYQPAAPGYASLASIFQSQVTVPSQVQVAMLLSAQVNCVLSGKTFQWTAIPQESYLHWVLDGVVVERTPLSVPPLAVSVALFASAEGLRTDLTGFKLAWDEEYQQRSRRLCRAVTPLVSEARVSLEKFVRGSQQNAYVLGGCLLVGGLIMSVVSPAGVFLIGGSVAGSAAVTVAVEMSAERALDRQLQKECERLRSHWATSWPAYSSSA